MTDTHEIHGTYATTETLALNEENKLETIEQGNERTFECSCGEEFDDLEEAEDHLREGSEPEQITIIRENLPTGTRLLSYKDYGNWMMIDIDGAKLPLDTVGPLIEQGYVVSGVLSNPDTEETVELRFWIRELDGLTTGLSQQ
jgi:hypothetical protein